MPEQHPHNRTPDSLDKVLESVMAAFVPGGAYAVLYQNEGEALFQLATNIQLQALHPMLNSITEQIGLLKNSSNN